MTLKGSTTQLYGPGASPEVIGGGVLVGYDQIATAAHAINVALQRPKDAASRPKSSEVVTVDFPFLDSTPMTCRVLRWKAPKRIDIAMLQLDGHAPRSSTRAKPELDTTKLSGRDVRVCGFPPKNPGGVWATFKMTGPSVGKLYRIDDDRGAGYVAELGFSGCPVWRTRDDDGLLGIVVQTNVTRRVAELAPAREVVRLLHFAEPERGTVNWRLSFFRQRGLTSLLNDLETLEDYGLENDDCGAVTRALGYIINELSDLENLAHWECSLHEELENLRSMYVEWNGVQRGPAGADARRSVLRRLRNARQGFSSEVRDTQAMLFQEDIEGMMDEIFGHLRDLADTNPDRFKNIAGMIRKYDLELRRASSLAA